MTRWRARMTRGARVRRWLLRLWWDMQERPLVWVPFWLIMVAIGIMLSSSWRLP